ncbi:MAG: sulfatase-like hydrolase/transferase [Anaerolineales bacterium]|nr:sulfatase-like hydrolase/transferase [Anaerolineales bacterium]
MTQLSRRDFLKAGGVLAANALLPKHITSLTPTGGKYPNIILILWDAFSARHLSLYGYPRLTTPNIDSFAARSIVFHNHYSGGNFTTTGTASMLTGMNAWKHRAINYGGLVKNEFAQINPYTLLGSDYYRFAFSQNPWPDRLMGQYDKDIDRFIPPSAYSLAKKNSPAQNFKRDRALATIALDDFLLPVQSDSSVTGSALLGYLNKSETLNANEQKISYRGGTPEIMDPGYLIPYLNENVYKGMYSELSQLAARQTPYFAYLHLYSPHFPYRPRNDYRQLFRGDGYNPVSKPVNPFSGGVQEDYITTQRDLYDRQIAQIDDEFGNLILGLEESGALDNSYLIFTSDHGELFERGFVGHGFQLMYEDVLRVPLIIHAPAQTKRKDVFTPCGNIDILPTILSIAGKKIPAAIDGKILPEFGGQEDENRAIFSVAAMDNSAFAPIKKAAIAMRKRAYKLIAYIGYDLKQNFELYHLENDPDELNDLTEKETKIFSEMKDELLSNLDEANRAFAK